MGEQVNDFFKKIHLLHILLLQLVQGLSGLKKSKEVYFPFRTHSVLFALFYIYLIFRSLCVHLEFWAYLTLWLSDKNGGRRRRHRSTNT